MRIKPPPADRASDGSSFTPRAERSQQRPTAEGSVGLWHERPLFGVGLFLQTVVLIDEVEYRVQTESDERSVLSARRVQPGLVLRFRFPGRK